MTNKPREIQKIRWIASYPKSGNTWMRMFISAYLNNGLVDINRPHGMLLQDTNTYFYSSVAPTDMDNLNHWQKMYLRPAVLLHACYQQSPRYPMFMKTHFCNCKYAGIEAIPQLLTENAIYVVRDPRDVVISMAKHRDISVDDAIGYMNNKEHALRTNKMFQMLNTWSYHVKSWTSGLPKDTLVVRYEDMVDSPRETFSKVVEHCGFTLMDTLLDAAIEGTRFEIFREQEDAYDFAEKSNGDRFFNTGTHGGWKGILTPEQVKVIEGPNEEQMARFGYMEAESSNLRKTA